MRTRSGIDSEIEKIEDYIDSIENKHVDLEKRAIQLEADLEVSRDEKRELESTIEVMQDDIDDLKDQIKQLEHDVAEAHLCDVRAEQASGG